MRLKQKMHKRSLAWIFVVIMAMSVLFNPAYASDPGKENLCKHHTEHTEECGYIDGVAGCLCQHIHTDECYVIEESCTHIHTEECYLSIEDENAAEETNAEENNTSNEPAEIEEALDSSNENSEENADENEDLQTEEVSEDVITDEVENNKTDELELDKTDKDGKNVDERVAEAIELEPINCEHVCSEESECIKEVLDCPHERGEHDDTCGYVEEIEGVPCGFVCDICNGDAEEAECICTALCTEDYKNHECPVCSAEDAQPELCQGEPIMFAARRPSGSYEAFDAARTTENGIFEFRVREAGSDGDGVLAYCFNYNLLNPDMISMGTVGPYYKLEDVSNDTFVEYAQGERYPDELKQNVLNVVWNGYPYYKGTWGGVNSSDPYTKKLYDIYYTQEAVWFYTDSRGVSDYSLIYAAQKNPAPANFVLDLYDGRQADGLGLQRHPEYGAYQNLLAVRLENEDIPDATVKVTVNKSWEYEDGSIYEESNRPSVEFELYEGDYSEDKKPINVIPLPEDKDYIEFTLLDDGKIYTIHEVMSGNTESFVAESDKTIDLSVIDDSIEIDFVNKYIPIELNGSFIVEKNVVGNEEDKAKDYNFEVTLQTDTGDDYDGEYTIKEAENDAQTKQYNAQEKIKFSLKDGQQCEILNIPQGTKFVVQEVAIPEGYELHDIKKDGVVLEGKITANGSISTSKIPVYTFTNNRIPEPDTVPLVVQKKVIGAPEGDANKIFTLNVKLFKDDNGTPYEGTYTLNASDTNLTYYPEQGIELNLADKEYAMIGGLTAGVVYDITEVNADGYEWNSLNGILTENNPEWLDFVNTYVGGNERSLTLSKKVEGDSYTDEKFIFTVNIDGDNVTFEPQDKAVKISDESYTVTLGNNESITFRGMPEGYSYFIQESAKVYDNIAVIKTEIEQPPVGSFTGDRTITSWYTNAKDTNIVFKNTVTEAVDLSLEKQVDSSVKDDTPFEFSLQLWKNGKTLGVSDKYMAVIRNADGTEYLKELSFDMYGTAYFELTAGQRIILKGLAPGEYNYRFSEINASAYEADIKAPATVDVNEAGKTAYQINDNRLNGSTSIVFTNKVIPKLGGLSVTKEVSGDGSTSRSWNFAVKLDDVSVSGTYGEMEFKNGVAVFSLKHGMTISASGLPAGISYEVTEEEANEDDYTTTSTNASGVIEAGIVKEVTFVNHKEDTPPSSGGDDPNPAKVRIKVEKTLDGKKPKDGMFEFVLKDEDGKILQKQTNDGDTVTFDTLSFDKSGTYNYTIMEKVGDDKNIRYDDTVYEVEIKVTRQKNYNAEVYYEKDGRSYNGTPVFENETVEKPGKDVTRLTVQKVWEGVDGQNRPDKAEVQLYRDNISYGDVVILDEQNGWQHTWTDLDIDYTWSVDEVNVPSGYVRSVKQDEDIWTITNKLTPPENPDDPDDPDDPDKPEVPDEPDKPDNENPDKPGENEEQKTDKPERPVDSGTPQTDDPSSNGPWLALALLSFAGMAFTARMGLHGNRRKHHR